LNPVPRDDAEAADEKQEEPDPRVPRTVIRVGPFGSGWLRG
jgi:hypothetical protein